MEKLANENLMKLYLNECLVCVNKLAMKSFKKISRPILNLHKYYVPNIMQCKIKHDQHNKMNQY